MSFRRMGKLLTLVGFVICVSLLGIMYGNVNVANEERDLILSKKNDLKRELEEHKSEISSLEVKVARLQSSLNTCNAAKLETEERNSLLQNDEDSLKVEVEKQKSVLESLRNSKEQEIQQLKSKLSDLESEGAGKAEAAEACSSSNDVLQQQLNAAEHSISVKEGELTTCIKEKKSLQDTIEQSPGDSKQIAAPEEKKNDNEGQINPVAAVPVPDTGGESGELKNVDHVADIPEIPQNKGVIDNKQDIPEAQAPAPQPVADKPVIPGDMGEAIAAVPPESRDETKRDVGSLGELGELPVGIQPLQPVPNNVLADSLEKVKQEEQLQQLQERQDTLLNAQLPQIPNLQPDPGAAAAGVTAGDAAGNAAPAQPALPQELQPAQPAPALPDSNNNIESEDSVDNVAIPGVLPNIADDPQPHANL